MDNLHSLPHTSTGTPEKHLDIVVETETGPMKAHEILANDTPLDSPTSIEGLRDRLSSQKGY